MAECTGGRTTRGTRSQFRLGMAGLGQCKGFYPIHFGNIMEGQSSHTGVLSSRDFCSQNQGTCTRAIREYEQTINEIRKENFDLKVKLYFYEESMMKNACKSPESKDLVEVNVRLNLETESLRNELCCKEKILQDALQKAEKCELDFKELETKYTELQFELSSLSELPSKEEYLSLLDENKNLVKHIESLEQALTEKEEEIYSANQRIEILADQNRILEEKIKKRSLAIQSFVYKNFKEKEMLPDELRNIVISATQAAKKGSKDDLVVAVKSIVSTLNGMMASVEALGESNVKEIESPKVKCLTEESLSKSSSSLPSQTVSYRELNQVQGLKEVLAERNISGTKSFINVDSPVYESYVSGKTLHESAENVAERDVIDCINISAVSSVEGENLISFSSTHSPQSCSVGEHNLINTKTVSVPPASSDLMHKKEYVSKSEIEEYQLRDVSKRTPLKEMEEGAHKASKQHSVCTQTDIVGCNLLNEYERDYDMQERNELHNRLADSCSINEELLEQLKNLEAFMEDLLQNKFDSSIESISEKSDLIFNLSKCLNKSLNLSNALSHHLSFCEGSKLFEECEFSLSKNDSYYGGKSLPQLDLSQLNMQEQDSSFYPRNHKFLEQHQSWQQLNPPMKQSEVFYQIENAVHKNIGYPSSESDIWSEPDRNISMQRIGISLQNSPVSAKSPRKLKQKDKRFTSRLSSDQDTSSFESQRLSKKRHGSASRRLFPRESTKIEDVTSGKFYILLSEKYTKLKSLFDDLLNIKDEKISVEMWDKLSKIMNYYERALQKLHTENGKNFPPATCGKCVVLELLASLMTICKEADFHIDDSSEQEILKEFMGEIHSIKEACKESFPLSIFPDIINKNSQSNQSDSLSENEHNKINELENVIVDLNDKNKKLSEILVEVKRLLSAEKNENLKLLNLNHIKHLKDELSDMKLKEKELSLINEELTKKLTNFDRNNSELNHTLKKHEDKRKESSTAVDDESEINKSELLDMCKRCLEYENELNQQISKKEEFEDKLKTSLNEKEKYLRQIKDLNEENSCCVKKLKCVQEEKLTLEKENIILREAKKALNADCVELKSELKNALECVSTLQEKCSSYENATLENFKENEEKFHHQLKQLEAKSLREKQKLTDEISVLTSEREDTIQMLKNEKECYENLMKEKAELNQNYIDLNGKNKQLSENLDEVKRLLNAEKNILETVKAENLKLVYQIKHLKDELSDMKKEKKELSLRNEELTEKLTNVDRNNSELNHAMKQLENKRKESSIALDKITAELQKNKSELLDMSKKCLKYENELNQQISKKEEFEDKLKTSLNEKEKYLSQIKNLNEENSCCVKKLKCVQEEKLALEKQNANLHEAKEALNADCLELKIELKNVIEHMTTLQKKCSSYENETLEKFRENEEKFHQQLKELEAESLREKQKLINEISVLTSEREDIVQMLKNEKECYQNLVKEKAELNKNYIESCRQITSLKLLNEELRNKQINLIQKNDFFAKALQSSNSECDNLNQDLKQLRETLQNLESKCLEYEKELIAAAGMKETLVECLLNINSEFSSQKSKLNKICKAYGNENWVSTDESSEFIPVIDEDNIQKLCENLSSESKALLQSVDMLLGVLKNNHLKSLEAKATDEKHKTNIKKEAEFHKAEIEHFKSQNHHLQRVVDELQKFISEKEKSVQFSAYEIQSLKEKIHIAENEIETGHQLLERKDDEITMLQERLFNLQTYINSIMADKSDLNGKAAGSDHKPKDVITDSASSDNQLPSESCLKVSKMCQTSQYEEPCQSADDTFSSTGTLNTSKNSCCERYQKKCYALQTKLVLKKKHIAILEEQEKDLKKHFLSQLQAKKDLPEKNDSDGIRLAELESKLEQKKAFIIELKSELLETCNSLIDKQNELDNLKQKLFEYEKKSKAVISDTNDGHSILTNAVDSNIQTLKNYKWRLIETIFDIQKKFYEKKGIHLKYIEQFKNHVNNIYSMQLTRSFSKSESMPLLGSHAAKLQYDQNDKLKNLLGLELDIECLENLKIFLDRFFVPYVLQTSHTDDKSTELEEGKEISFDELKQQELKCSNHQETDVLDISFPDIFSFKVSSEHRDSSQEKSFSFESFASNISHHLDYVQNFFTAVKKCQWLEDFDASSKDKAELKSLLLKIFQEIKNLHESSDNLFELNSILKNTDFFVAASSDKPDMSDRESIMSEETITVSHSESFEDVFPIKLPHPEMMKLEEKNLKPGSLGDRLRVVEPYDIKVTAVGSSCDSVCHRSYYSSPDLGIESDPNHDSSAPEQKDDSVNKYQRHTPEEQKLLVKTQQKSAFTSTESAGRWSGHTFGENLYAIVNLPHYELLKKEIKESLVAIKSVLSRTGDGLHLIGKYTSPRKTLEYNTMKSIKDSCVNIEVYLKAASDLVEKFWTAPCPSEEEWKFLTDENQHLCEQLANLRAMNQNQESEFKKALGKLEHAQVVKANMEKKISKKLVKTKKVIRQAELKLIENRCQNLPPLPKYPSDETQQSPQANLVQQT